MSSTRRAAPGAAPAIQRYMSAPEYMAMRGIDGNTLAKKAAFLGNPQKTSLLLFLQAMSTRPGGLEKFAASFLAKYEARMGSRTMHKAGMRRGLVYSVEQSDAIAQELNLERQFSPREFQQILSGHAACLSQRLAVETCLARCRKLAESLPDFIVELCKNPKVPVPADGETVDPWCLPCFKDIGGALLEYQREFAQTERRDFVMTDAARQVFDALDAGLRRGGITMIEGVEGIGKTEAIQAWCRMHYGEARYVSLKGIVSCTRFFGAISKALALPCKTQEKMGDMQQRVEEVLDQTRLMLVMDEAQYLLPQGMRVSVQPELINWIYTACTNQNAPVAIVATSLFGKQMQRVEQQVAWNSGQFKRRIRNYVRLPDSSTAADLLAVARKLMPGASPSAIKLAAGMAHETTQRLTNLVNAIAEAKFIAGEGGRDVATFDDIEAAFKTYVIPSEQLKAAAFEQPRKRSKANAAPVQDPLNGLSVSDRSRENNVYAGN